MKLASANSTPKRSRAPRRGLATGLLLLMLVFLSGFVALGVNIVRLRQIRSDLRLVCRSAALAGASELMDEGALTGVPNINDDVYAAQLTTAFYAQMNRVGGRPVVLNTNTTNTTGADIMIGAYDPAGPVNAPIVLPSPQAPCEMNTVRVTARLQRSTGNRVTMWFGSLLGVMPRDVVASAQATIDRRVCGFRPEPHVHVPVVPMVANYSTWMSQCNSRNSSKVSDQYAVDYQSGAVTSGSDGVPEITLVYSPSGNFTTIDASSEGASATDDGSSGSTQGSSCAVMMLPKHGNDANLWATRCLRGLSMQDLNAYGGELVLWNGVCQVPLESTPPAELPYALMEMIGQPRAWPLAQPGAYGANVSTFAAGRIVAVMPMPNSKNNAWQIIVQPSTLVCSQAVASVYMTENPWIAKLELTQ